MQDLVVVINNNPERLTLAIPTIVPVELRPNSHCYTQDCTRNRLVGQINIESGEILHELSHLFDLSLLHDLTDFRVIIFVNS